MVAGIVALTLTGMGAVLVLTGIYVSLSDRKRKLEQEKATAEGTAGDTLEGLTKLADALRQYPLGMQLIFLGIALMLAGGGTGGVGALVEAASN